jgi:hypothetical protein
MDESQYKVDDFFGFGVEPGNNISDAAEWHHDLIERFELVQADNSTSIWKSPTHPNAAEVLQRLEENWPFKEDYACFSGMCLMGFAYEHDQNIPEQRPTFNDEDASCICPSKLHVSPNSPIYPSKNNEVTGGLQLGCGDNVTMEMVTMEMITPRSKNVTKNSRSTRSRGGQNRRPCDLK